MKNDGGPAFPREDYQGGNAPGQSGMSLRDYFAGEALSAVIAAYVEANGACIGSDHIIRNAPAIAFKFADAMLKERNEA